MKTVSFAFRAFPPPAAVIALASVCAAIVCSRSPLDEARADAPILTIVYPGEGARIPPVTSSFAFGATTPGAAVTVNGVDASVAPDGGWIAYVPFAAGTFVLHVRATLDGASTLAARAVDVDAIGVPAFPSVETAVQPGDAIPLAVQAHDGDSVSASGPGFSRVALAPDAKLGSGAFSATVRARSGPVRATAVAYRIVDRAGHVQTVLSASTLEVERGGLTLGRVVSYSPDPGSGTRPYGMLSDSPGTDTQFTVPLGTDLPFGRRQGDYVSVSVGDRWPPMWIDRRQIVPDRVAQWPPPWMIAKYLGGRHAGRDDIFTFRLAARMAFSVSENSGAGTMSVNLLGPDGNAYSIGLPYLARPIWGYSCRWVGDDLEITVRKPPRFAPPPAPALRGLVIVVDPGHAPDSGAVGPLGTLERDVNLDIALRLRDKLAADGARVVMTRDSAAGVPLYDRPALAERIGADALVSVHNNSWPDGVDPRTHHGFTIFYFQEHSVALANAMRAAYAHDTDLPDLGAHVGDFALVRSTYVPAVLTESAFISWPLEEMRLRDPAFRDRFAFAMADGLERWAEAMRRLSQS